MDEPGNGYFRMARDKLVCFAPLKPSQASPLNIIIGPEVGSWRDNQESAYEGCEGVLPGFIIQLAFQDLSQEAFRQIAAEFYLLRYLV